MWYAFSQCIRDFSITCYGLRSIKLNKCGIDSQQRKDLLNYLHLNTVSYPKPKAFHLQKNQPIKQICIQHSLLTGQLQYLVSYKVRMTCSCSPHVFITIQHHTNWLLVPDKKFQIISLQYTNNTDLLTATAKAVENMQSRVSLPPNPPPKILK